MNFSFIGKALKFFPIKKIFIGFLLILVAIGGVYLVNMNKTGGEDTMLLVHSINKLQKDIQGFQTSQSKNNNSEVKGKIDPELVNEFKDDEQFLQEVVKLKKEKLLYQLSLEVEGLKRQKQIADQDFNPAPRQEPRIIEPIREPIEVQAPPPPPPPRPQINLALANESNQSAVVTVDGGNPITLRIGSVVSNYKLIAVTRNYIQVEDLINNTIESVYMQ